MEDREPDEGTAVPEVTADTAVAVPDPAELSADKGRRDVTADKRFDSTISRRLKANPAYWRALNRSWQLRTLHERAFTRKGNFASTRLSKEADAELRDDLEKDTEALEVFIGRRLTEWGR